MPIWTPTQSKNFRLLIDGLNGCLLGHWMGITLLEVVINIDYTSNNSITNDTVYDYSRSMFIR